MASFLDRLSWIVFAFPSFSLGVEYYMNTVVFFKKRQLNWVQQEFKRFNMWELEKHDYRRTLCVDGCICSRILYLCLKSSSVRSSDLVGLDAV